jgi:hypothetical protein
MSHAADGFLAQTKNADGGWGYQSGGASFTEPTSLCVIALSAPETRTLAEAGITWLLQTQRHDGGWGALHADSDSGWHTSTAVWALGVARRAGFGGDLDAAIGRGAAWLLGNRSRALPLPNPATKLQGRLAGWPWTAGTFGWVIPTGLALLALRFAGTRSGSDVAVSEAISLLRDRRCSGGGWNWGNPVLFGSNLPPYATETAVGAVGLLAAGVDPAAPEVSTALDWLAANLDAATGVSATAWSLLALRAGGRAASSVTARLRSTRDGDGGWRGSPHATALAMLALGGGLNLPRAGS